MRDPRLYQILVLASLLVYGVIRLDLEIPAEPRPALGPALLTQYACTRALAAAGLRSQERADLRPLPLPAAAQRLAAPRGPRRRITIASKFVLRVHGKHVFNPTNFGIVAPMLATGRVWVSPGQWGSAALFGFLSPASAGWWSTARRAATSPTPSSPSICDALRPRLWLGQPLAIPLHQLASGAFLIFTFFMISDPRTTPDSRAGRIFFALLVALGAGYVHFVLYRPNGLMLSLFFLSPPVPLIDRLLPGARYAWREPLPGPVQPLPEKGDSHETPPLAAPSTAAALARRRHRRGFCGFYVAKADTKLFNQASQVVLVRDGDRTVLTMANDFKGDPKEFAVVIPVPTVLQREQIHVATQP